MSQAGSLGEEVGERPTHSRYGLDQNGLRGSEVQTHMPGSAISEDVARTERDTGRQLRTQVAVAARTADELAHDQQCPALTEHVEPIGNRTVLVVVAPTSHAITLSA